jgi:hypothetical protein
MAGPEGVLLFEAMEMRAASLSSKPKNNRKYPMWPAIRLL